MDERRQLCFNEHRRGCLFQPVSRVSVSSRNHTSAPALQPHRGDLLPHRGDLQPHRGDLQPHQGDLLPHRGTCYQKNHHSHGKPILTQISTYCCRNQKTVQMKNQVINPGQTKQKKTQKMLTVHKNQTATTNTFFI